MANNSISDDDDDDDDADAEWNGAKHRAKKVERINCEANGRSGENANGHRERKREKREREREKRTRTRTRKGKTREKERKEDIARSMLVTTGKLQLAPTARAGVFGGRRKR